MIRSYLPFVALVASALIAGSALVMLVTRDRDRDRPREAPPEVGGETVAEAPGGRGAVELPEAIPGLDAELPEKTAEEILAELGMGAAEADPARLVGEIAAALERGDAAAAAGLIGRGAVDEAVLERLRELGMEGPLRLREPGGIREVGELELNALARWVLEFDGRDPGRDRFFLDLRRRDGRWSVERLTLPPGEGEPLPRAALVDPLGIADAFLQAVLRQDFEFAREFVDGSRVSDAKIAGLCILFEEGEYRLRPDRPLRSVFLRDDRAGYLANVESADGAQVAQFAIMLALPSADPGWQVVEVNLDELLADYAHRVAGGDAYYSPLVRHPAGGETIALYFGFDEDEVSPRTKRQLEIVSMVLLTDPKRRITLSGHTDSLGTASYNDELSARRAQVVRDSLIDAGVDPAQIVTLAKGASQPRRPNVTESGEDDPDARRVNRRTEVYLDF